MPRKPRFKLAGMPVHVVQRGNNRQAVFYDEQDHRAYLRWLEEGAERYGCAVHAYVLMTNHWNALGQPDPVIVSHGRYRALGQSELQRQEVYRGLFTVYVNGGQLTQIREAWQTGTPLGNDRFREQVGDGEA